MFQQLVDLLLTVIILLGILGVLLTLLSLKWRSWRSARNGYLSLLGYGIKTAVIFLYSPEMHRRGSAHLVDTPDSDGGNAWT